MVKRIVRFCVLFLFINQIPKTSAVDKHTLFAALCSAKCNIAPNKTIATPSAQIWTELNEQLDNKMSAFQSDASNASSVESDCEESHLSRTQDDIQMFKIELPFDNELSWYLSTSSTKGCVPWPKKRMHTILKPHTWTHIFNQELWRLSVHLKSIAYSSL